MAPRLASRPARENDFSNVGKVGRRTGVTLPQGRLDLNGMEEITGIFSSPRKPSPLRKSISAEEPLDDETVLEQSREMTGLDSTRMTPSQALSARKSLPPPRSASPRKSGISGTARRNKSVDVLGLSKEQSSSASPGTIEESHPILTPTLATSAARRFSPKKTPLRTATSSRPQTGRTTRQQQSILDEESLHESVEITQDQTEPLEETDLHDATEVVNGDDYVLPAVGDDDEEAQDREASEAPSMEEDFNDPLPPPFDDEEADQTFEPEKREKPQSREPTIANSRRKRKSDALEQEIEMEAVSSPAAKRAKRISDQASQRKQSPPENRSSVPTPPAAAQPKKRGRPPLKDKPINTDMSVTQQGELKDIIEKVRARPGRKKSLYLLKREKPNEESVTHTRSGRVSIKPLAYWRNERCVYGGSPGGINLQDGARFPLNSVKEIIRARKVDDTPLKKSRSKKKSRGRPKATNPKPSAEAEDTQQDVREDLSDQESESESESEADSEAEPWETEKGIFRGPVSLWDGRQQTPLEDQEEIDIAYAQASIATREVKGSTFRYAKLYSSKNFGSGIVDLPPGSSKRPKNSRKMHMCFFVATGRVTVQVGPLNGEESRFSVGTGGWWQVPRGNQYSMENNHSKPARVFFSQGCELVVQDDEE